MILECKRCEALVNAEFVAKYDAENEVSTIYSLFKCPKCRSPFLTDEDLISNASCLYPRPDLRVNPNLPAPFKAALRGGDCMFQIQGLYGYRNHVQEDS